MTGLGAGFWVVNCRALVVSSPLFTKRNSSSNKQQTQVANSPSNSTLTMAGNNNQAEVIDLVDVNEHSFTIAGNPPPMPRARSSRSSKHFYNSTKVNKATTAFRADIQMTLPETRQGLLFAAGDSISTTIQFYIRRPDKDFVSSNRPRAMLKRVALGRSASPTGPDVDNLAKFVLDALNGLVYPDDRQIVKLVVLKLRDNEGECHGRTVVNLERYVE